VTDYQQVKTIDGLFDEKAENQIYNLYRARPWSCLLRPHTFVNASLMWEPPHKGDDSYYSISLEGEYWGKGYGGIRFCRRCKKINCIHIWDKYKHRAYEISTDKYYSVVYSISTCKICGRRIYLCSSGESKPNPLAFKLIDEVAVALGRRPVNLRMPEAAVDPVPNTRLNPWGAMCSNVAPYPPAGGAGLAHNMTLTFPNMGYGSGWSVELPVQVSRILDSMGEQAARHFIEQCFSHHAVSMQPLDDARDPIAFAQNQWRRKCR